jgi:hypothetical protein
VKRKWNRIQSDRRFCCTNDACDDQQTATNSNPNPMTHLSFFLFDFGHHMVNAMNLEVIRCMRIIERFCYPKLHDTL